MGASGGFKKGSKQDDEEDRNFEKLLDGMEAEDEKAKPKEPEPRGRPKTAVNRDSGWGHNAADDDNGLVDLPGDGDGDGDGISQ